MNESKDGCGQQQSTCLACGSPTPTPSPVTPCCHNKKQTNIVDWEVLDTVSKTVMKDELSPVAEAMGLNATRHTPVESIEQRERPLQSVNQIMATLP